MLLTSIVPTYYTLSDATTLFLLLLFFLESDGDIATILTHALLQTGNFNIMSLLLEHFITKYYN